MKISLNELTNDFSHKLLLYVVMLLMQKKNMSLSNKRKCLQEKIDQWETADKSVKIFFVLKVLLNKMVMKIQAMALILTVMIILMICVQEKLRELFYCLFSKTDDKERYFLAMERS